MTQRGFTIPEIVLIGGTRIALGVGLGFLISGKVSRDRRKAAGWALLVIGALSTIPIVMNILGKPVIAERQL